ncbi:MAG: electron transfer flavoprotein subunit alpha/FixB family protein [Syntrophales bacterium]
MQEFKGILICDSFTSNAIPLSLLELLTVGHRLADATGEKLGVFVLGDKIDTAAEKLFRYGVDTLYGANDVSTTEFHPELYTQVLAEVCRQVAPSIILFPHNDIGRDVAPRLAARLKATICMDCINFAIDPDRKNLVFSKPVYGGQAIAAWAAKGNCPVIVTVRARSIPPAEPWEDKQHNVVLLDIANQTPLKTKLIETVREELKGIKMEDAKIIIAGGGGIGSQEGFQLLTELAEVLQAAVGVSRAPCDEGWMTKSLEIGQTGHVVSPKIYIAIGISGALQHMAGCSGSKYIIAINKDPGAHIFSEADVGIVGDYRHILPPLISNCKKLWGQSRGAG